MIDREALILLNMARGIGSNRLRILLEHFAKPQDILAADTSCLMEISGIGVKLAREINLANDTRKLSQELKLIQKHKIKVITILDEEYPLRLKEIHDPPIVIYVKGQLLPQDLVNIAVVGSRRASYYGLICAEKFAYQLAGLGITITSGGARGVDAAAHKGALKAHGRTLAIVGCGLDNTYPPENEGLFAEISERGALISEFSMGEAPLAKNFPRRNRIISGLSCGVLVVEAARNSGALITADFALEQGRDVFALPGKVDSDNSYGTNELIKQGAKLVSSVEDILEELKIKISIDMNKKTDSGSLFTKIDLDEKELKIFNILSAEPKHIEIISNESSLDLANVMDILLRFELKKIVTQLPGKQFVLKEEILLNE
jgi:DNA processing protein